MVASSLPFQSSIGCGGCQRSSPTGGSAYGMERNCEVPSGSQEPRAGPRGGLITPPPPAQDSGAPPDDELASLDSDAESSVDYDAPLIDPAGFKLLKLCQDEFMPSTPRKIAELLEAHPGAAGAVRENSLGASLVCLLAAARR